MQRTQLEIQTFNITSYYYFFLFFSDLKVVSSKNYGGSKLVFIDGYGPGTVALDIVLSFKLASILFIAYFRFRSVLPNL